MIQHQINVLNIGATFLADCAKEYSHIVDVFEGEGVFSKINRNRFGADLPAGTSDADLKFFSNSREIHVICPGRDCLSVDILRPLFGFLDLFIQQFPKPLEGINVGPNTILRHKSVTIDLDSDLQRNFLEEALSRTWSYLVGAIIHILKCLSTLGLIGRRFGGHLMFKI